MKKAVLYSRVSTQEQFQRGFSLEMMEKQCRDYVALQGGEIVRKYVDAGYSGVLPFHRRPSLRQLLEDIKTKKDFDSVVVWRLDRLTRCLRHLLDIEHSFSQAGISLKSASEMIDTSTAGGRAFFSMIGAFAEYEVGVVSHRTFSTMATKVGVIFLGGRPPLGYRVVERKLVVDESTRAAVELIFKEFIKCKNLSKTARVINERKIPTASGRTWSAKKISRLLQNPAYCGFACWDRKPEEVSRRNLQNKCIMIPRCHEALVDEKTFNRVQKIFRS